LHQKKERKRNKTGICECYITAKRVGVTIVGVEKAMRIKYNIVWVGVCVCVCVLLSQMSGMQSACAVLRHLWPVWLYNIIPHYLINGRIFGNNLVDIKCVFGLFYEFRLKYLLLYEEFSKTLT